MSVAYKSKSFMEQWRKFSLAERMGHIGSEITRARAWQEQENKEQVQKALGRALELIELTLSVTPKNRELKILKEVLEDIINGTNRFDCSLKSLENYCLPFAILARNKYA